MCGIAGILGTRDLGPRLSRMLDALAHRGPDGDGTWLAPSAGVGLGHRRLAIIDPAGGAQPLRAPEDRAVITFNGCIYNYVELREELRGLGHSFRTESDTEVLLAAYEAWGSACVERFNGMWAFAIWDAKKGPLFAARDRLGIKPFYYATQDGAFYFASEIKALLAAGVHASADPAGLQQYLTFQFCLGEQTMFQGVRRLPPGHRMTLVPGEEPQLEQYWDIEFSEKTEGEPEALFAELRDLLEDAVRLRLRSDVPLGAHLSGGLDSSTVTMLASRLGTGGTLKTFTGAFDGSAYDETPYAKAAAKAAGAEYLEQYFTPEDFAASIEDIVWHMDEPAMGPGVFPQHMLSQLATKHVKVVLGGQGGDEIFLGYARHLLVYLEECLRDSITGDSERAGAVSRLQALAPHLDTLKAYTPMIRSFFAAGVFQPPGERYFRLMDRAVDARALLSPEFEISSEPQLEAFHRVFDAPQGASTMNRIAYFDLKTHLQGLLHVEDRTSMAASLESRVPLLDHRIVEALARVPVPTKLRDGRLKHLFRELVSDLLPPKVLNRTDKMGFPVPLAGWMKSELRNFVGDILLGDRARQRGFFDTEALAQQMDSGRPFSRSLWGALNVELWHRRFLDG